MLNNILGNSIFWIVLYLTGFMITTIVISLRGATNKVENRIPKPSVRIFILITFVAPPVALPFTKGPKLAIVTPVALTVGIIFLIVNFIIKAVAQKQIGAVPALKSKGKLVTTSIYRVIRNPLYISNGLLAVGMAILFKSLNALLFSIPYCLFYLLIIYFEEKDLLEKYGEEYKKYKENVRWKLIPRVI